MALFKHETVYSSCTVDSLQRALALVTNNIDEVRKKVGVFREADTNETETRFRCLKKEVQRFNR